MAERHTAIQAVLEHRRRLRVPLPGGTQWLERWLDGARKQEIEKNFLAEERVSVVKHAFCQFAPVGHASWVLGRNLMNKLVERTRRMHPNGDRQSAVCLFGWYQSVGKCCRTWH